MRPSLTDTPSAPRATLRERTVKGETLVRWGDSDRVFPRSVIPAIDQGLARHQTVVLSGCGHAAMMEQLAVTARHWRRFLDGLSLKTLVSGTVCIIEAS